VTWRATREALAVTALFAVLTLAMTWPGARHPFTHVIGRSGSVDLFNGLWNLWWVRTAAGSGVTQLYFTDRVFHPYGMSLALHDLAPALAVLSLPFQPLGLPFAYNVTVWMTFVLSGLAMYYLAREITANRPASFFAAALFAFSAYRFAHATGHLGLLGTFGLPAYAWTLVHTAKAERTSPALMAASAGCVALNGFLHLTYLAHALILGVCFALWLLVDRRWPLRAVAARVALPLAIGLLPAVAILSLGYRAGTLSQHLAFDGQIRIFNGASLRDYFTPNPWHPLWRLLGPGGEPHIDASETTVYVGWLPLLVVAGAVVSIIRVPIPRFFLGFGLVALLLSLEPVYRDLVILIRRIFGRAWLVHNHRVPTRFSVLVLLAVSVLAAVALGRLLARVKDGRARIAIAAALTVVVLAEHAALPVPVTALSVPDVYRRLAEVPGDLAILRLPLGWGWDGVFDVDDLYDQTIHGKPLVGGYVARETPATMRALRTQPLIAALLRLQEHPEELARADLARLRLEARGLVEQWRIGFVAIAIPAPRDRSRRSAFRLEALNEIARAVFPVEPWYDDGSLTIYRVRSDEARHPGGLDATWVTSSSDRAVTSTSSPTSTR